MARALKVLTVLALVLAGCSRGGSETIRLQVFGDPTEVAGYRSLIAAFESRTPGAKVALTPIPQQGDHMARLATAFSGGSPPDLFIVNYRRFGQFAAKGVLEPLGARLDRGPLKRSEFYPQALEAFTVGGSLLCLPQNISSLVVYYNRALFRRFDVPTPTPGWTWTDFVARAKALTKDTDDDGAIDIHGVGVEPNFVRLAPFVWQGGGAVVDDEEAPVALTLNSRGSAPGVAFFGNLIREHSVVPSLKEAASEDLESRFANGRLGMFLDSRKATPGFRTVGGLDWDVAPLPAGPAGAATILHADAYCMAGASKNKDRAQRFVEFALGPEGASIVARAGRTVPSLRSVAEGPAFLDPAQKPKSARAWLDAIPTIRRLPNVASWNEAETRADVVIEEWFYSTERPEVLGLEILLETSDLFTPTPGP